MATRQPEKSGTPPLRAAALKPGSRYLLGEEGGHRRLAAYIGREGKLLLFRDINPIPGLFDCSHIYPREVGRYVSRP
jgi:hypothetical protein